MRNQICDRDNFFLKLLLFTRRELLFFFFLTKYVVRIHGISRHVNIENLNTKLDECDRWINSLCAHHENGTKLKAATN